MPVKLKSPQFKVPSGGLQLFRHTLNTSLGGGSSWLDPTVGCPGNLPCSGPGDQLIQRQDSGLDIGHRYRDIHTADGVLLLVTIYLNILNTSWIHFMLVFCRYSMHASHPLTCLDASPVTRREDGIIFCQGSVL